MPLTIADMRAGNRLAGHPVFVSASIPDPSRWRGDYDTFAITDAATAVARAILTESGTIVTAAHPTIAPLLLYVAAEFPSTNHPAIAVYQSRLFAQMLPKATERFEHDGVGVIEWTEATPGEKPIPGSWNSSLRLMRERMVTETKPVAAVFIGGMEGVGDEHSLFRATFPERPWYAFGRPGGVPHDLAVDQKGPLAERLQASTVYPTLARAIVTDILESLPRR